MPKKGTLSHKEKIKQRRAKNRITKEKQTPSTPAPIQESKSVEVKVDAQSMAVLRKKMQEALAKVTAIKKDLLKAFPIQPIQEEKKKKDEAAIQALLTQVKQLEEQSRIFWDSLYPLIGQLEDTDVKALITFWDAMRNLTIYYPLFGNNLSAPIKAIIQQNLGTPNQEKSLIHFQTLTAHNPIILDCFEKEHQRFVSLSAPQEEGHSYHFTISALGGYYFSILKSSVPNQDTLSFAQAHQGISDTISDFLGTFSPPEEKEKEEHITYEKEFEKIKLFFPLPPYDKVIGKISHAQEELAQLKQNMIEKAQLNIFPSTCRFVRHQTFFSKMEQAIKEQSELLHNMAIFWQEYFDDTSYLEKQYGPEFTLSSCREDPVLDHLTTLFSLTDNAVDPCLKITIAEYLFLHADKKGIDQQVIHLRAKKGIAEDALEARKNNTLAPEMTAYLTQVIHNADKQLHRIRQENRVAIEEIESKYQEEKLHETSLDIQTLDAMVKAIALHTHDLLEEYESTGKCKNEHTELLPQQALHFWQGLITFQDPDHAYREKQVYWVLRIRSLQITLINGCYKQLTQDREEHKQDTEEYRQLTEYFAINNSGIEKWLKQENRESLVPILGVYYEEMCRESKDNPKQHTSLITRDGLLNICGSIKDNLQKDTPSYEAMDALIQKITKQQEPIEQKAAPARKERKPRRKKPPVVIPSRPSISPEEKEKRKEERERRKIAKQQEKQQKEIPDKQPLEEEVRDVEIQQNQEKASRKIIKKGKKAKGKNKPQLQDTKEESPQKPIQRSQQNAQNAIKLWSNFKKRLEESKEKEKELQLQRIEAQQKKHLEEKIFPAILAWGQDRERKKPEETKEEIKAAVPSASPKQDIPEEKKQDIKGILVRQRQPRPAGKANDRRVSFNTEIKVNDTFVSPVDYHEEKVKSYSKTIKALEKNIPSAKDVLHQAEEALTLLRQKRDQIKGNYDELHTAEQWEEEKSKAGMNTHASAFLPHLPYLPTSSNPIQELRTKQKQDYKSKIEQLDQRIRDYEVVQDGAKKSISAPHAYKDRIIAQQARVIDWQAEIIASRQKNSGQEQSPGQEHD